MQTKLTTFDTMTADLRSNKGWALMHNLIITDPNRAVSRTYMKNAGHNTYRVFQYVQAKVSTAVDVYGWGKSGSDEAWYKFNVGSDDWDTLTSSSGNMSGTTLPIAFSFEGNLYGFTDTAISKCTPGSSFNTSWYAANYLMGSSWSSVCEPVLIGDYAYFAMDNKVYELAPAGTALTERYSIGAGDSVITSITPLGGLLSVMTYNIAIQRSVEYLFNVGSTETKPIESFDWGNGRIVCHESVNSIIMAIQDGFVSNAGDTNGAYILLKRRSGGQFVTDARIPATIQSVGYTFANNGSTAYTYAGGHLSRVYEDKLYTRIAYVPQIGESVSGILSYDTKGAWYFEITDEYDDDTSINQGFIKNGSQWLIAHSINGTTSVETMQYSPFSGSSGSTTYNSTLITRLIDHGDRTTSKSNLGATVTCEPLSASGTISLYYKRPDDSSWTLVATQDNEDATRLMFVNTGTIPNYREIQFKIVFQGAVITGFEETSVFVKDKPYDTR